MSQSDSFKRRVRNSLKVLFTEPHLTAEGERALVNALVRVGIVFA